MNIKTLLIGVICAAYCHGLSAEEIVIADDNFQLVIGEGGTNALKSINKDATIYDLNNFAQTECWNKYVKQRLSDGGKLSNEDVKVIRFCLNVKIEMVESLACIILRDMIGPDAFDRVFAEARKINENSGMQSDLGYYTVHDNWKRFAECNSGIRVPMKAWASMYTNVTADVVLDVLSHVEMASRGVEVVNSKGLLLVPYLGYPLYVYKERTPSASEIMRKSAMITKGGKDIDGLWTSAHERTKRFPSELLGMINALMKYLKNDNFDSGSMRLVDEILSEVEAHSEYAVRMYDYVVYDLPFCILSYRALGRLKECKGYVTDDEVKMRVVAADYADAICGTEMLKGIRTRYAASCYVEIIKFLKSELGWFTQDAFKEFANETKLYNITLRADENSNEGNTLEKWR